MCALTGRACRRIGHVSSPFVNLMMYQCADGRAGILYCPRPLGCWVMRFVHNHGLPCGRGRGFAKGLKVSRQAHARLGHTAKPLPVK